MIPYDAWWIGKRAADEAANPSWRAEQATGPSFRPLPDTDRLRRGQAELERMAAESDLLHRTAYHESAHCYVAWRHGFAIRDISIDHRGAGVTNCGPLMWDAETAAIMLAAGVAGERLRFSEALGTGDDDAVIADLARICPGAVIGVHERAEALVREGRDAIDALASALIKRRSLGGAEAVEILAEQRSSGEHVVSGPAEVRAFRIARARRATESRGETWTPVAEAAAHRALDDEYRNGVVRDYPFTQRSAG